MQDETTVGFLKEAMSCVVTEERNGVFELSLTYPIMVGELSLGGKLSIGGNISFGLAATNDLNFSGDNGIAFGGNTALRLYSGSLALGISNKNTAFYGNDLVPSECDVSSLGQKSKSWYDVFGSYFNVCFGGTRNGSFGGAGNKVFVTYDASGASGGVWLGKASGDSYYGYVGVTDSECTVCVDLNAGDIFSNGVQVKSTEDIKRNIAESGSALDAIRQSKIYTYNLVSDPVVPVEMHAVQDVSSATPDTEEDGVVVAQSEEETLNGASAPIVSDHTSTGFVIGRETPDAVLSEDGEHIDLYAMAALNWRATQELLERIERLEELRLEE